MGYDPAGNRLFEQIDDTVTAWTYDRLNRLVTQQAGGVLRVAGTINEPATVRIDGRPAIVDASGVFVGGIQTVPGTTRFTVTATDASGNTASQAYDVDQLGTPKSFTFDPNGNLTSDGTRTFEWDAWNRLTKLTEATISISYSYDGFSRRASSVSKSGATTTEDTRNVWCGLTLCQIRGAVGAPTLTAIYQFGTVRDGVASHMVRDHLMSAREVTDSAGVLQARYEFGPWGQRTLTEGSDTTSFGFTGQPSSRTNIWNMTYRDYEATTTRWLNEDPIGLAGGINLYGYVGGNPVSRIDPSGLVSVSRSDPQRINTTTRAIGGACGRYDPNALFLGS